MKNLVFILFASLLFTACNNKADQPAADDDTLTAATTYYWEATDTGDLAIVRHEGDGPRALSIDSVIAFLNRRYANVQLVFVKTSHDTLFTKIPESTILTQQMGSTGALYYLVEAVYNLTEIPGIRYVDFDFEEGDHALPGTRSRNSLEPQ